MSSPSFRSSLREVGRSLLTECFQILMNYGIEQLLRKNQCNDDACFGHSAIDSGLYRPSSGRNIGQRVMDIGTDAHLRRVDIRREDIHRPSALPLEAAKRGAVDKE